MVRAFLGLLVVSALAGCIAPTRPPARTPFEVGRDAAQAGDYPTAIAQLTLAVETAHTFFFTQAYLERGECHLRLAETAATATETDEHLAAAQSDFQAVVEEPEAKPREKAQALYGLGTVALARGSPEGAEETARQILELPLDSEETRYRLGAHRRLGWLYFDMAGRETERASAPADGLAHQEGFRRAQEHFSRCLDIDPNDEEGLLGKGLCLHFRGQYREAIRYLERSTESSRAKGVPNPRGHYYLARTLELERGLQGASLDHYTRAIEDDASRAFAPLYAQLVRVVPVYLPLDDPRALWFLDRMLEHSGDSPEYWKSVEALASRLVEAARAGGTPGDEKAAELRRKGIFARSLARARGRKVDQAVEDALFLADDPEFSDLLVRIFPADARVPEYLYGRARALLGSRRYGELGRFFQDRVFQSPPPELAESAYYHRTLVLEGQGILERWISENPDPAAASTPEAKLERDKVLGRARDAFQKHLERYGDDAGVRRSLGKVQELMEAYASAFLNYAMLARQRKDDDFAFERISELHGKKLLPQADMLEAWAILREYSGTSPAVREYVERTRQAIRAETLLYCRGCGRKAAPGDRFCLECGREIAPSPPPAPEPED
ncbi:MAG: tetratricopeptide repeat protein [Planctomycetota bacterium]